MISSGSSRSIENIRFDGRILRDLIFLLLYLFKNFGNLQCLLRFIKEGFHHIHIVLTHIVLICSIHTYVASVACYVNFVSLTVR